MSERETNNIQSIGSEVIEKIDFYAKKYDIPRGKLMRNLIIIGLDDMNILHKQEFCTRFNLRIK